MYAIIDVETTGLSPARDRIIEIAVLQTDGETIGESFVSLVNPEQALPEEIHRLTGITSAALQQAPRFYEIARRIVEITRDCILVAHNARFDYAFLRSEFKRYGYHYHRKQLCTLRMSRLLLPGLSGYRLHGVCRHLGIPLQPLHRAERDAAATLQLYRRLRAMEKQKSGSEADETAGWRETLLPPALQRKQVDELPEAAGVYLFYEGERLLYVGKSVCIRKRVLQHFSGDLKSARAREMKQRIRRIRYEVTGSELAALLLESDLIKKLQPRYNRGQRRVTYRHGLFLSSGPGGYQQLQIAALSSAGERQPLIAFSSRQLADNFLTRMVTRFALCQRYCHQHKSHGACFNYHLKNCRGACIGEETAADYNRRVAEAVRQFDYPLSAFYIVEPGREKDEQVLILIEDGVYRGFGYCRKRSLKAKPDNLRRYIEPRADNQDVRRLLLAYMRRNRQIQILPFAGIGEKEKTGGSLITLKNFINLAST